MTNSDLSMMSVDALVEAFEMACLGQSEALKRLATNSYNKSFRSMMTARDELNTRKERPLLARLYDHADPQVRYQAALATLAFFPEKARAVIQIIGDDHEWPSDALARGTLRMLDDGTFVPN